MNTCRQADTILRPVQGLVQSSLTQFWSNLPVRLFCSVLLSVGNHLPEAKLHRRATGASRLPFSLLVQSRVQVRSYVHTGIHNRGPIFYFPSFSFLLLFVIGHNTGESALVNLPHNRLILARSHFDHTHRPLQLDVSHYCYVPLP